MNSINFLLKTPIAHRGLHDDKIPENSLAAFRAAIKKNHPIELDVHLIKSGEVIVFHDDRLRRMCGIDADVCNCTFTKIRELYLKDTEERIPLLTEALDLINGQVPVLIELKCDRPTGKLEASVIDIMKNYNGKYALQSFSPFSLKYIRKHAPKIPRGQLSSDLRKQSFYAAPVNPMFKNLWFNPVAKPDFISYDIHELPNKRITNLRKKGIPVLGWTVRTEEEREEALKSCDNLICENIL